MKLKRPGRDERDSNYGTVYFYPLLPLLSFSAKQAFYNVRFSQSTTRLRARLRLRHSSRQLQDVPGSDDTSYNEKRHDSFGREIPIHWAEIAMWRTTIRREEYRIQFVSSGKTLPTNLTRVL